MFVMIFGFVEPYGFDWLLENTHVFLSFFMIFGWVFTVRFYRTNFFMKLGFVEKGCAAVDWCQWLLYSVRNKCYYL